MVLSASGDPVESDIKTVMVEAALVAREKLEGEIAAILPAIPLGVAAVLEEVFPTRAFISLLSTQAEMLTLIKNTKSIFLKLWSDIYRSFFMKYRK